MGKRAKTSRLRLSKEPVIPFREHATVSKSSRRKTGRFSKPAVKLKDFEFKNAKNMMKEKTDQKKDSFHTKIMDFKKESEVDLKKSIFIFNDTYEDVARMFESDTSVYAELIKKIMMHQRTLVDQELATWYFVRTFTKTLKTIKNCKLKMDAHSEDLHLKSEELPTEYLVQFREVVGEIMNSINTRYEAISFDTKEINRYRRRFIGSFESIYAFSSYFTNIAGFAWYDNGTHAKTWARFGNGSDCPLQDIVSSFGEKPMQDIQAMIDSLAAMDEILKVEKPNKKQELRKIPRLFGYSRVFKALATSITDYAPENSMKSTSDIENITLLRDEVLRERSTRSAVRISELMKSGHAMTLVVTLTLQVVQGLAQLCSRGELELKAWENDKDSVSKLLKNENSEDRMDTISEASNENDLLDYNLD